MRRDGGRERGRRGLQTRRKDGEKKNFRSKERGKSDKRNKRGKRGRNAV